MRHSIARVIVFLLLLVLGAHVGASADDDTSRCDLLDYRHGLCHECNCRVECWTCTELMSSQYDCARRNGIPMRNVSRHLGTYSIGDAVAWSLTAAGAVGGSRDDSGDDALPTTGWLNGGCATHQALDGTGLKFEDDASLHGTVTPLAEEQIWFVAFHATRAGIVRLNLHLYINTHRPAMEAGIRAVDPGISSAADAAIAIYRDWEGRRAAHADTVAGMNARFADMKRILDDKPKSGGGFGWGLLGALHMNTHKLLDNVLLEAERYLGLALTFGGEAAAFAEQNLEGCYAKRNLEAAKFLWMDGMERTVAGIEVWETAGAGNDTAAASAAWREAELLFTRAAGKKEGWGWGVNNGEIWLGLASSKMLLNGGMAEDACSLVEQAADRNARLPWTLFLQAFCRDVTKGEGKVQKFARETRDIMMRTLDMARPRPRASKLPPVPWTSEL